MADRGKCPVCNETITIPDTMELKNPIDEMGQPYRYLYECMKCHIAIWLAVTTTVNQVKIEIPPLVVGKLVPGKPRKHGPQ